MALAASLADLKAHLNMTEAGDSAGRDQELTMMLGAATRMVEKRCGPVSVKTFTEYFDHPSIILSHQPVIEVISVTPSGGVDVAGTEAVRRLNTAAGVVDLARAWCGGTITYTAGRTEVPENLKTATLIIAAHLWETQRGATARPGMGGGELAEAVPGRGYALPNAAEELIAPDADGPAVA